MQKSLVTLLASILLVVAASAPVSAQVRIDFEFLPGPDGLLGTADDIPITAPTLFSSQLTQLTDEYSTLGIDFLPAVPINDMNEILDAASFSTPPSHTPPNLLASNGTATIEAAFSVPVFSVSALIGISGGADEMEIFDAAGSSLGAVLGDDVVVSLNSVTPIARLVIRPISSTTPAIDNLSFDSPSGPRLLVSNLVAGQNTTLSVSGATPGGQVGIGYSLAGAGPITASFGPCANLSVQLSQPIRVLPPITADAAGTASLQAAVPPGTTGVNVWIQALDVGSCTLTNGLAEVIG